MHIDNWLFFLFVAVVMLFRWLMNAANKASKDSSDREKRSSPSAPPPVPRASADSDEQRIRKFLEALGQPPGSRPPPPVTQPRPTYQNPVVLPHVGPGRSPLPPLKTRPPDLPRKTQMPPITQAPYEKKEFKPVALEGAFEVQPGGQLPSEPASPLKSPADAYAAVTAPSSARVETNLAALLRSPSGLRNAIILREIFGPPRSMQEVDFLL